MSSYLDLFDSCILMQDEFKEKELCQISDTALLNKDQYEQVSNWIHIPWPLIASIHFRESNQSFHCHLHNGDPLSARTIHVPAGRPVTGQPPFTWVESAVDALMHAWHPKTWDIAHSLEFLERYNGMGYQKHGINTPYLWDFTNHYTAGLFTSDGSFDRLAKESRPGAVAILKSLSEKGVSLDFTHVVLSGDILV